ncbi:MAG TPA: GNAT family N-acetyltransferase [Micromonospora sp.]|nr:GNAT family N-acetyltransferase [Micromonospora sp.]
MTVRRLAADEYAAAWELRRLAFGRPVTDAPPDAYGPVPGTVRYGAFDARGRLLGTARDLHHEQWWSGRRVVAADVAGVAVLPEARGRGVARALLTALLREAYERGAAVSALFPTVAAPYRACGWEICGALRTVDLPTALLPRHRPTSKLSVRPGNAADLPAVQALYEQVARDRAGLLTRDGELFTPPSQAALPANVDGLTLVEEEGRLLSYATWQRGQGYDTNAVLTVHEVLAVTPEAARELLSVLTSWQSVTPTLRLTLLGADAISTQFPLESAREHERWVWMHRPVDVVRAVQSRGWPPYARGVVDFSLNDVAAPWNSGFWRLEVADGDARLQRLSHEPTLRLSVRGFALLYAGAAQAEAVAEAGLLQCHAGEDPAALNLLGAGPPAQLLDYF